MTLTLVLNRSDEAGFQRYLRDVYDPHSRSYRHFLTPIQLSDRFGPSRREYGSVVGYLKRNGLDIVERSPNRMTVTVRGGRSQVERTFGVRISDYSIGTKTFYANDRDPALPRPIATSVQAVQGLSDLNVPHGPLQGWPEYLLS